MLTSPELISLLAKELNDVANLISDNGLIPNIPTGGEIDYDDCAILVAKTSNVFSKLARLNGIAKAQHKLCKAAYDRKLKIARGQSQGSNAAVRETAALEAVENDADNLDVAASIAIITEGLESAAKVASESARKIFGAQVDSYTGEKRSNKGNQLDNTNEKENLKEDEGFDVW